MPWIKKDSCAGCGVCMFYCPEEAISMNSSRVAVIDQETCVSCGKCIEVCPRNAVLSNSKKEEA
ncbi:MAG: 4Fe-4S binding protein [Clostridiales bacterium]|nr:4Fe-4S binding protein [Clostridiales bacterium]